MPELTVFVVGQRVWVKDGSGGVSFGEIVRIYPAEEAHVDQGVPVDACPAWARLQLDDGEPFTCDIDKLGALEAAR